MEYVQRAKYHPDHPKSHMVYNRVHLLDNDETLCGRPLDKMWYIVGDTDRHSMKVTCPLCRAELRKRNNPEYS